MPTITTLTARPRPQNGKGPARRMRVQGDIPAIIYGDKQAPENIAVASGDIARIHKTGRILSTLLELNINNKKQRAIARDLQLHPVSDNILHIDFLRLGAGVLFFLTN